MRCEECYLRGKCPLLNEKGGKCRIEENFQELSRRLEKEPAESVLATVHETVKFLLDLLWKRVG